MRLLLRRSLFLALSPLLTVSAAPAARAANSLQQLRPVQVSGTVAGYDNGTQLIAVNTRMGLKSFIVNNRTLVLLNNHSAALTAITAGDEVTVEYQYETSTANTIHLFREASRSGTVVSTTTTAVNLRLKSGAVLTLTTNAGSVVDLEGIRLTSNSVLVGRRVTAVYEPGTFTLLSLEASSKLAKGTITAVDPEARTLVISGPKALTFAVHADATVRRAGSSAALTDLTVGDKVTVAYLREASTVRALALTARPAPVSPNNAKRKN